MGRVALTPNRNPPHLTFQLYPLEIPPANLLEIGQAIRTSNHMAKLSEKHHRTVHGATEVMKDQVLMDLPVSSTASSLSASSRVRSSAILPS